MNVVSSRSNVSAVKNRMQAESLERWYLPVTVSTVYAPRLSVRFRFTALSSSPVAVLNDEIRGLIGGEPAHAGGGSPVLLLGAVSRIRLSGVTSI
jgi:hypothetical protein